MLPAHYAPRAQVVLAATVVEASERAASAPGRRGLLLPRPAAVPEGVTLLIADEDPAEYARVLYARLRQADRLGLALLVVVPPPEQGLGVAVADRLRRAATATDPTLGNGAR